MLSLRELHRVATVLDAIGSDGLADGEGGGWRLERIVQPEKASKDAPAGGAGAHHRVTFTLSGRDPESGERAKRHFLLCCETAFARVSELGGPHPAPPTPPSFAAFLRARLAGARLQRVHVLGADRQLGLRLAGPGGTFELVLSIFGRRSNIYLLDADLRVLRALRPTEETRAEMAPGEHWRDPERPPTSEGDDRFEDVADSALLTSIESHYAALEADKGEQDLTRRLEVSLRKERKGADRRLVKLEAELAEADEATRLQKHGELLKTVLSQISPGDSEVRASDFETGEEVAIPLDPTRSPKQNLDAIFKHYQKLLRRLTKAGGQIETARERSRELAGWQAEIAEMDAEQLEAFASRSEIAKLLARHAPVEKPKGPPPKKTDTARVGRFKDVPRRLHPRRYTSGDGLEIWVGRNDDANDFLTTRLARGNDLFFHLDGAPGSHVVLRVEKGSQPPEQSLLDACELAVHFSKAKKAGRADVHIVPIKQVKKPKGAKPGLVWVTGGRSLHLRREAERLKRVLESQEDD